jgi:hypothetical protein
MTESGEGPIGHAADGSSPGPEASRRPRRDWTRVALLDKLRSRGVHGRIWLLFSHRLHEGRAWVYALGRLAPVLEIWEGEGALVALIEVDGGDGASPANETEHGDEWSARSREAEREAERR